jgi:polyphosphate kinase 2
MIKKYLEFIKEEFKSKDFFNIYIENRINKIYTKLSKSTLDECISDFSDILEDYKDLLVELIQSGNGGEIDITYQIGKLDELVEQTILKELNLVEFLRIVGNIIDIPKANFDFKIEKVFLNYTETLKPRFERLLHIKEEGADFEHEDMLDNSKSVLSRDEYESELRVLQIQMNRFQKWVKKNKKKVAIVFEGRDSAGKGSNIKRFTEYLPTNGYRVVTMGIPEEKDLDGDNWFKRYEKHMPKEGEIVFFDRSWYGMGLVNPTMGYCTEEQYLYFMENVNNFEQKLDHEGIDLIKFWFSITPEMQKLRFKMRQESELKYWKYSPNDLKSLDKWDLFTKYKEQCFAVTSTRSNPWVIVMSNDKKLSQLNSIRYVLSKFNYIGKDSNLTHPYPDVVYELK